MLFTSNVFISLKKKRDNRIMYKLLSLFYHIITSIILDVLYNFEKSYNMQLLLFDYSNQVQIFLSLRSLHRFYRLLNYYLYFCLQNIVLYTGIEPVIWKFKVSCCAAYLIEQLKNNHYF